MTGKLGIFVAESRPRPVTRNRHWYVTPRSVRTVQVPEVSSNSASVMPVSSWICSRRLYRSTTPLRYSRISGLGHELGLPRGLLVQVLVERVLVDEALGVRQIFGILVPVPGVTDSAGLVDGDGVEAQLVALLVQHVDPPNPAPTTRASSSWT
jgi:hypothetical protein